jgi:branched-chain amino acid transport system ATP-binding protein
VSQRLSVQDIGVRFGGVQAVDGARFEVGDNELLGVIGPNGAGKTTLLRVITGVVTPSEGSVALDGADVTNWPTAKRIQNGLALAQQIVAPLRALTLIDNVALAVGHKHLMSPIKAALRFDRAPERERALDLLGQVGLSEVSDKWPEELPLGYLKRLEVARALALEPRLLLLDEPLAGLNQAEAHAMANLIASLPGPGLSVVLIEHNLGEVTRICPRLYVQNNGRPLAFGPTAEVMARADVRAAYLGAGK